MTTPSDSPYSRETFVAITQDPETGRTIRQLTDHPKGLTMGYFRVPKHVPDGWLMARLSLAIHPETGRIRELPLSRFQMLHLDEYTGQSWLYEPAQREVWSVDLPFGIPRKVATLPSDWPANRYPIAITCDGQKVIAAENNSENIDISRERDSVALWRYFNRKRNGSLWSWDLYKKQLLRLAQFDTLSLGHILPSPTHPEWIAFSADNYEAAGQRIWAVKTDGSDLHAVRPQERGEWISHEFWMPDGLTLGYKYQDRRHDPELMDLPWAEYSHVPTHFGLADVGGEEVFKSDPLNHYHSHVMTSLDSSLLLGEGTDGHPYIYAARLDRTSPRVDFIPQASLHAPYVPTAGMHVNGYFSRDHHWLLYSDQVNHIFQICAVEVDTRK